MDLQKYLDASCKDHTHLCPRQILGVRLGLAGLKALGFEDHLPAKRLLVIVETDGCFVDGLIAATGCTVGHRSLRVEDYGKTAATFIDTITEVMLRVAPRNDVRLRAVEAIPDEAKHYFAQMKAYQILPDDEMFTFDPVLVERSISDIISRPGARVNCDRCGEEIMNEREIVIEDETVCIPCAGGGYARSIISPVPANTLLNIN